MSVSRTSAGRRWLLLVPGAFVVVGLVVLVLWWQYFKTTPAYALALLIDAAQQNDRAEFDQVVDLDRVIDNFIAQGAQESAVGLTTATVMSVRTQLQSLAPEPVAVIKEGVRQELLNRVKELAGPAGARPFVLMALALPFLTEIKQSGESAQVRIKSDDETELIMERRSGRSWTITALRDQTLARRVVTDIVKRLPQSESELDKQLRTLPEKLPPLPLP